MITTIVLGAGASKQYGYPTGPELLDLVRAEIGRDASGPDLQIYNGLSHIGIGSLDEYVKHDNNAGPKIKKIIGEIIFGCEDQEKLNQKRGECLYSKLFSSIPPEKYESFRVVSFNYDRSLEAFFIRGLVARNRCNESRAFEILNALKIVHVHNRLPDLPYENGFSLPISTKRVIYGEYQEKRSRLVDQPWHFDEWHVPLERHAQERFKTCYENTEVCPEAAKAIQESQRVVFLGFGYHDTNMKTLGYDFNNTNPSQKRILGTAKNLSGNEWRRIESKYPEIALAEDCNCVELLEEFVCLEDAARDGLTRKQFGASFLRHMKKGQRP